VTILQRGPRLVAREDEDIAQAITEILKGDGITVRTGVDVREVGHAGGRVTAAA